MVSDCELYRCSAPGPLRKSHLTWSQVYCTHNVCGAGGGGVWGGGGGGNACLARGAGARGEGGGHRSRRWTGAGARRRPGSAGSGPPPQGRCGAGRARTPAAPGGLPPPEPPANPPRRAASSNVPSPAPGAGDCSNDGWDPSRLPLTEAMPVHAFGMGWVQYAQRNLHCTRCYAGPPWSRRVVQEQVGTKAPRLDAAAQTRAHRLHAMQNHRGATELPTIFCSGTLIRSAASKL